MNQSISVSNPPSRIPHRVYHASRITHLASHIRHLKSNIQHRTSNAEHPTSNITYRTPHTPHLAPIITHALTPCAAHTTLRETSSPLDSAAHPGRKRPR